MIFNSVNKYKILSGKKLNEGAMKIESRREKIDDKQVIYEIKGK